MPGGRLSKAVLCVVCVTRMATTAGPVCSTNAETSGIASTGVAAATALSAWACAMPGPCKYRYPAATAGTTARGTPAEKKFLQLMIDLPWKKGECGYGFHIKKKFRRGRWCPPCVD